MSAETGVGPAIASGSHTKSGICALLPVAPMKSSTAAEVIPPAIIAPQPNASTGIALMVSNALLTPSAGLSKKLMEGLPACEVRKKTSMMPSTTPQSPMRLATKAFFAASPASLRSK